MSYITKINEFRTRFKGFYENRFSDAEYEAFLADPSDANRIALRNDTAKQIVNCDSLYLFAQVEEILAYLDNLAAPEVDAGADVVTTIAGGATLVAGATPSGDSTIASILWELVSGPVTSVIDTETELSTDVTFTEAGVYVYSITVVDSEGMTNSDTVQVTVS